MRKVWEPALVQVEDDNAGKETILLNVAIHGNAYMRFQSLKDISK